MNRWTYTLATIAIINLAAPMAFAKTWLCWSRDVSPLPVKIELNDNQLNVSHKTENCRFQQVRYDPLQERFQGWKKFSFTSSTNSLACQKIADQLFAENGSASALHWFKVSSDLQNDRPGSIEVGHLNNWDPAEGGTVSSFFFCPKSE